MYIHANKSDKLELEYAKIWGVYRALLENTTIISLSVSRFLFKKVPLFVFETTNYITLKINAK